jgi:hypothetical protein
MASLVGCLALLSLPASLPAQALIYTRSTFMEDPAANTSTVIDFDTIATGTDLALQTMAGATFTALAATPLEVITGSSGVRYTMSPSTGLNVLSPGGNNPSLEDDDLQITFASPMQAAGLDVVLDDPDGYSYVSVSFYGPAGELLAQNTFIPAPFGAPGYQFVGLIANPTGPWITKIVIDEYDGSANDDNIAFDSLVFATPIPEPATVALQLLGVAALAAWRRCRPSGRACRPSRANP